MSAIHALLGCDWGRGVGLPDDKDLCGLMAKERVMVHDPETGAQILLQLCDVHLARLTIHTDPHKEDASSDNTG